MPPLTLIHIAAGTLAVLSGIAALSAAKGAPFHRGAGRLFVMAMLVSSVAGATLGLLKYQEFLITVFAGILASYLVLTGWLAVRDGVRTASPTLAFVFATATAASLAGLGVAAFSQPGQIFMGFPAEDYVFLSGIAAVAAALDASVILRGGIAGRQRVARHLWRMCFAFFMAAGSLFTGPGATVFPEPLRESGLLSLPELAIAAAMVVWLGIVLFTRRFSDHVR